MHLLIYDEVLHHHTVLAFHPEQNDEYRYSFNWPMFPARVHQDIDISVAVLVNNTFRHVRAPCCFSDNCWDSNDATVSGFCKFCNAKIAALWHVDSWCLAKRPSSPVAFFHLLNPVLMKHGSLHFTLRTRFRLFAFARLKHRTFFIYIIMQPWVTFILLLLKVDNSRF